MKSIYEQRPFKVKNAEEYDANCIIELFVNPVDGLYGCFDYDNAIVKGKMGSGKTMLLKANYAFYISTIIPSIISNSNLTIPVYLRLSDFQNYKIPDDIYSAIIIKIIEEMSSIYLLLQDSYKLAKLHNTMTAIPSHLFDNNKLQKVFDELAKLGSEEYIEKVSNTMGYNGKIKHPFFQISSDYKKDKVVEIKNKRQPGISDVFNAYETLLKAFDGKVLLLIDEVGSIDKSFFTKERGTSYFETLMNQLRTTEYIRTKVAIYPHSVSDILLETRYGNLILLDENVFNDIGYKRSRIKAIDIISKYINICSDIRLEISDIFEIDISDDMANDCLEQIIYASGGNTRKLIHLLDIAMNEAYKEHLGNGKVTKIHVENALIKQSSEMENLYYSSDIDLLNEIASICKKRKTFKFQFPYKSPTLLKYTTKSEEQNILIIDEAGTGRRGNTYRFDYSYCVTHEIPTHHLTGTDRIDKTRSRINGNWAKNIAHISEDLLVSAGLPGKIEGVIDVVSNNTGFVKGEDGNDYYLTADEIVSIGNAKLLVSGVKVRFLPTITSNIRYAQSVEVF